MRGRRAPKRIRAHDLPQDERAPPTPWRGKDPRVLGGASSHFGPGPGARLISLLSNFIRPPPRTALNADKATRANIRTAE